MKIGNCFALLSALVFAFLPVLANSMDLEELNKARTYVAAHGIDEIVEMQSAELRRRLPIQRDENSFVSGVWYDKSSKMQFFTHTLIDGWDMRIASRSGISTEEVRSQIQEVMRQRSIAAACSTDFTLLLLENGLRIRHLYIDQAGRNIFSFDVVPLDCTSQNRDD